MKNHKEMFEALLAGETLTDRNNFSLYILDNDLILENSNKDRLRIETLSLQYTDNWQIKQKTININGFEVPEPCREEPKPIYTEVYLVDFGTIPNYRKVEYIHSNYYQYLQEGLVHLTKEAAELHAKALLSFTKKETK